MVLVFLELDCTTIALSTREEELRRWRTPRVEGLIHWTEAWWWYSIVWDLIVLQETLPPVGGGMNLNTYAYITDT